MRAGIVQCNMRLRLSINRKSDGVSTLNPDAIFRIADFQVRCKIIP